MIICFFWYTHWSAKFDLIYIMLHYNLSITDSIGWPSCIIFLWPFWFTSSCQLMNYIYLYFHFINTKKSKKKNNKKQKTKKIKKQIFNPWGYKMFYLNCKEVSIKWVNKKNLLFSFIYFFVPNHGFVFIDLAKSKFKLNLFKKLLRYEKKLIK